MRKSQGPSNPGGAMKVKVVSYGRGRNPGLAARFALPARLVSRPPLGAERSARRSESVHVGTRKMVNYA